VQRAPLPTADLACWFERWRISETPGATIEQAAEVGASLAEVPVELAAREAIQRTTWD
jgi:hypothetical protein